jgi:hypothetical protein
VSRARTKSISTEIFESVEAVEVVEVTEEEERFCEDWKGEKKGRRRRRWKRK